MDKWTFEAMGNGYIGVFDGGVPIATIRSCTPEFAAQMKAIPDLVGALETIADGNTDPDRMVEIAAGALRKAAKEVSHAA